MSPRSRVPISLSVTAGSSTMRRMSSSSACRSSPLRARSARASVIRARAADSRPDSAWSNSSSTSSSTSTTDCVIRVSRIGYFLASSRRARCCAVRRRPTPARNRRRSAGSTDKSSVCASIPRKNASFSSSSLTAAGVAAAGPVSSHARRVHPSTASTASSASSSACRCGVSSGATRSHVSLRARSRAVATRSRIFTTPGRTSRDDDRYSHAWRNSSFGESCSIARANRNSSRSFQRGGSTCRQPR